MPDTHQMVKQLQKERDILQQRLETLESAHGALSKREKQYHALYTSMAEGVALHEVIYDETGTPSDYRIIDINPSYEAITGLTRERAVGTLASVLYGTGSPPYLKEFTSVLTRGAYSFETYFPPMEKHFSISLFSPGPDQFATVFFDITERKNMEETLKASEEKYRLVVENANEAIFIAQDGMLKYINPIVIEITGYSETELMTLPFIHLVHPDDQALVAERYTKRLAGEEVPFQYTFRIITQSQEIRYLEINSVFILWQNKPASLNFVNDVTERRQMEQERIRTQRLRAVGELSAGVSHNLNNILTGILGPAQLLQMQSKDPHILQEADTIFKAAIRARDLVHRLHVSTRQVEEESIHLHAVRVNGIIEEAIVVSQPRLKDEPEARGISIEVHKHLGDIPPVSGTASGLHDILVNLLFNAADAMPEGGTLTLTTRPKDEGVEIVISDTGIGMDDITRQQIFEPFFTTKMDVGSGLGLYMVYGTLARWQGNITVSTKKNKGTTFTLWLPQYDPPEKPDTQTTPVPPEKSPQTTSS